MTAIRKITAVENFAEITGASLFDGGETGLFTSGLSPVGAANALMGDAVEMFTSGLLAGSDAALGEATGLFTSGLSARGTDMGAGDAVEMFTSGLAASGRDVTAGEGCALFTSGL